MATEAQWVPFRNSRIRFSRWGYGPEYLLCLHGYGEEGGSFAFLEKELGKQYTLIAIDFPFHGGTDWQEEFLFDPPDLVHLIHQIIPNETPMTILGYSMGGRVALQLLQLIPGQIRKLVLVAPDGLHRNKWQWLATRTGIGNRLFKWAMQQPGLLLGLMDLAGKLGLYHKSLIKFVHFYLDDAEQRMILYRRWTTMRKFKPDLGLLKKIIRDKKIPVSLLFGRYDRVIRAIHGYHFSNGAEAWIRVVEIEAGHQLLREKHLPSLLPLLFE
ncbi:MAG: alpha/beta hydrolase [Bacteroidota bacterium]